MNPKRDDAANDGARKTSSIIFFRFHRYPNQLMDRPSHNRRLIEDYLRLPDVLITSIHTSG